MGNCTGYCISDAGPDAKRKITVEQNQGDNQNQVYINEQRQEFEIEYGNQGGDKQRVGVPQGNKTAGQYGTGGYIEPNDKLNQGPT